MSTEHQGRERRRGERVLIRVPVQLNGTAPDGSPINEAAEAVVVSRFGALLRTHTPLQKDSALDVTNGFSNEVEKFRVVWVSDRAKEGRWDVGVEALNPRVDFWGIRFPATASPPA